MSDINVTPAGSADLANANAQAATAASTPQPASDWTAGLNDEMKGYVQNKGFKDPASVLDSYRNYEKLMGVPKERIAKIPEKDDDAAGWDEVYNKLGRPLKPEEYKIESFGGEKNDEVTGWAKKTFHELGLTRKQAEAFAAKLDGYTSETMKSQTLQEQAAVEKAQSDLKREWGSNYDQNLKVAKFAATKFGLKPEVVEAIEKVAGFPETMKFFQSLGATVGEHSFVGGDSAGAPGRMTPEGARSRIQELIQDSDFARRYTSGDSKAVEEMNNLHVLASSSER